MDKETKKLFWKCDKCGGDNEAKRLFCRHCGETRPPKNEINFFTKVVETEEVKKSTKFEPFDWFIIVLAMLIAIDYFIYYTYFKSLADFIQKTIYFATFSACVSLIAFLRLFFFKSVNIGKKLITFSITCCLNPVILLIIFFTVMAVIFKLSEYFTKITSMNF